MAVSRLKKLVSNASEINDVKRVIADGAMIVKKISDTCLINNGIKAAIKASKEEFIYLIDQLVATIQGR